MRSTGRMGDEGAEETADVVTEGAEEAEVVGGVELADGVAPEPFRRARMKTFI